MKPTEAQLEAYKAMAKESAGDDMESQIRENLQKTCDKFPGNEDKLDRCLEYLNGCAMEILDGKNGDVPDEVCFRICRDYFNDEIWKKEDEEKAEALAKKKAEAEAKKKAAEERKAAELKRKMEAEAIEKKIKEEEDKRKLEDAKLAAKGAEQKMKADVCPGQLDFLAAMGV